MSAADLIDPVTVRKFLEMLHARAAAALSDVCRPGVLHLVSMAPDDRGMSVSPFNIGDIDQMLECALTDARANRNVYVEARTVRPGRPTARGKIEATIGVFALVIDRDADKGKAGHVKGNASAVVETSAGTGNSQEWLFLRRALDAAEAKSLGKMIRKATATDATGVITQPYRVPGTPNLPDARKRDRGRVVVPTQLITVTDKLWGPAEIEAAFSTSKTQAAKTQPAKTQPVRKATGALKRPGPTRSTPRLVAAVKRKLAAKVTAGVDRSAKFQSAVNAAVHAGMTVDQFEDLARQHSSGCVSKYLENGDRLRVEIDRSWSKTEETKETGPAPDASIDGAELLDQVHQFLGQFIAYPDRHSRVAHTLWIGHCHLVRCFETTPRLAFLSPEPSSGKTRCLEITELLVPNPVLAVNVSPAYLIRRIAAEEGVTVLFDEIDTVFGPRTKENNEDVRALLNAGYRRRSRRPVCHARIDRNPGRITGLRAGGPSRPGHTAGHGAQPFDRHSDAASCAGRACNPVSPP
jgi:hypothetical protein